MRNARWQNGLVLLAMLAAADAASGQFSFTAASDQRWHDEDNWQPEAIPGIGQHIGVSVTVPDDKGPAILDVSVEHFLATMDAHGLIVTSGVVNLDDSSTIRGLSMDGGQLFAFPDAVVTLEDLDGPTMLTGNAVLSGQGEYRNIGTMELFMSTGIGARFVNEGTARVLGEFGGVTTLGDVLVNRGTLSLESGWIDGSGTVRNENELRVSGNSRLVDPDTDYEQENGRLIVAPTAKLELDGPSYWLGGDVSIGDGADLRVFRAVRIGGPTRFVGPGRLRMGPDADELPVDAALTFDLRGGELSKITGRLRLNADAVNRGDIELFASIVGPGEFRNAFGATVLASSAKVDAGATFTNLGSVTLPSSDFGRAMRIEGDAELVNAPGGRIEMRAMTILGGDGWGLAGVIRNEGLIVKAGNSPHGSKIDGRLEQQGGTLRVLDGSLNIRAGGEFGGADIEVEAPGRLSIEGHEQSVLDVAGPTAVSGTGVATFGSATTFDTLLVRPGGTLSLSMVGEGFIYNGRADQDTLSGGGDVINTGNFRWNGGRLGEPGDGTTVRNQGAMFIGHTGVLNATLTNFNAVSQLGTFDAAAMIDNRAAWKIDEQTAINDAGGRVVNTGTFAHDNAGSSIVRVPFDNRGTVHAARGVLTFTSVEQISGERLTGGTWSADANARIDLPRPLGTIIGGTSVTGGTDSMRWLADLRKMDDQTKLRVIQRLRTFGPLVNAGRATIETLPGGVIELTLLDNGDGASGQPSPDAEVRQIGGGDCPGCDPPLIITPRLENHARLVPGGHNAAGPFNLEGDLFMHPTGRIVVEVGGLFPDQHDAMQITGEARLEGTLDASPIAGFQPDIGDEVVVAVASGGVTGRFAAVASPLFGPPGALRRFRADYGPNEVRLVTTCGADFTASANAGDPGYGVPDFQVGAADFFYFLDQFVTGNATEADITGDGMVGVDDFFAFLDLFVQGCD